MVNESDSEMPSSEQLDLTEIQSIEMDAKFFEEIRSNASNLLVTTVEVATDARAFPTNRRSRADIPPHHFFFWLTTRGQWIWHPLQGPCGPEGQGPGDDHFFLKGRTAGALCGVTSTTGGGRFLVYETRFDESRGGLFVFQNDSASTLTLFFICNDHDDEDSYADNSGTIIHTIQSLPM